MDEYHGLAFLSLFSDPCEAKTERKAVSETIITATDPSTCNQKRCQEYAWKKRLKPMILMQAIMIMKMLRLRKTPMPSF